MSLSEVIQLLIDEINALPNNDFKDPSTAGDKKSSLIDKIDVVLNLIDLGKYDQAIRKLEKDIKPKLDTDCNQCWLQVEHEELIVKIKTIILLLEGML